MDKRVLIVSPGGCASKSFISFLKSHVGEINCPNNSDNLKHSLPWSPQVNNYNPTHIIYLYGDLDKAIRSIFRRDYAHNLYYKLHGLKVNSLPIPFYGFEQYISLVKSSHTEPLGIVNHINSWKKKNVFFIDYNSIVTSEYIDLFLGLNKGVCSNFIIQPRKSIVNKFETSDYLSILKNHTTNTIKYNKDILNKIRNNTLILSEKNLNSDWNILLNDSINKNFFSKSQINQDVTVLDYFKNKKNGYFIEIGANDGITLSNTYLLEKYFDWKGICVEPLPTVFSKLVESRPKSICINKAVFETSGMTLPFDISEKNDLLSGLSNYIGKAHADKVEADKTTVDVTTITFNDILDQNKAPLFIDYLSLDTEGTELMILKSLNLNKYTFGIIDVEHNFTEPRRSEIREYLLSNGYSYKRENKFDDTYIHNSLL